jgi:FKBP-type peptidyl-prolyl cis-trans isomerase FkpA
MKKYSFLMLMMAALVLAVGCKKLSYKKTASGLTYNIFPGKGKDSLIKDGNVIKFHVVTKLNDSVMYSSYGKAPAFQKYMKQEQPGYNFFEILPQMRAGDSAITVQMVDTLMAKGAQMPPNFKKGDRIITSFRILKIFTVDSLAQADFDIETEKDAPRQMKEQEELRNAAIKKQDEEYEKSGEIKKGLDAMESYLKAKNITAQKTGKGTYVLIQEQGTGPQAENGKFVKVKYTGRLIENDSTFDQGVYPFQLGTASVIRGWDEGLLLFKQGGKGVLFIPGFLAYGNNPNSRFKPFAAMKFDIELLEVSDKPAAQ